MREREDENLRSHMETALGMPLSEADSYVGRAFIDPVWGWVHRIEGIGYMRLHTTVLNTGRYVDLAPSAIASLKEGPWEEVTNKVFENTRVGKLWTK